MRAPRTLAALLAGGLGLLVYLHGAAPGVLYGDSAELQAAALAGGVGHPSGYPTFILLGQVFGKLLGGDPAHRVNAMSAVFGAAGLAVMALALAELGLTAGATLAGSLVLGASFTFWWASLRCEVYTVAVTLFLLALWRSLVAIRTRRTADACAAAFLMGLAMTGHLIFGPAVILMAACVALPLPLTGSRRLAAWALLVTLFLAGLSPYATLAVADRHTEATNYLKYTVELAGGQFGLTPERFASPLQRVVWLMFGTESHPFSYGGPGALARGMLRAFAQLFLFELGPPGLVLCAIGLWRLRRPPRPGAWLLAGIAAVAFVLAAAVKVTPSLPTFLMPCTLALTAIAAIGFDALIRPLAARRGETWALVAGGLVALLVIPVPHLLRVRSLTRPIGPLGWTVVAEQEPRMETVVPSLRGYDAPRRYGERVMRALPESAFVAGKWREIMLLKYLQTIERERPDLTLDPWYTAHVARLERWQLAHRVQDHPFVMVGPIPDLRPLFGAADSVALEGADYFLVRRTPLPISVGR